MTTDSHRTRELRIANDDLLPGVAEGFGGLRTDGPDFPNGAPDCSQETMIAYWGPKVAQLGINIWWRFQSGLVDIELEFSPKGGLVSKGERTQTITIHPADLDPVTMPEMMITPYSGMIHPAEYRRHVQVRFGDTPSRFAQLQNIPQGILDQFGPLQRHSQEGDVALRVAPFHS